MSEGTNYYLFYQQVEPSAVIVQWQWEAPSVEKDLHFPSKIASVDLASSSSQQQRSIFKEVCDQHLLKNEQLIDAVAGALEKDPKVTETREGIIGKLQQAIENAANLITPERSQPQDDKQTKETKEPQPENPPQDKANDASSTTDPKLNQRLPPSEFVCGETLKRLRCLNLFDSCTVQLGDISFYVPTPKDRESILERSVWRKIVWTSSPDDILEPVTNVPSTKSFEINTSDDEEGVQNFKPIPDLSACINKVNCV